MSQNTSLFPLVAGAVTAFTLTACIILTPDLVLANTLKPRFAPAMPAVPHRAVPRFEFKKSITVHTRSVRRQLDENDALAALESLHFALSEVADGSSYVWQRSHGGLSGIVQIAASFRGSENRICRRAIVVLTSGEVSERTETVACRETSGVWKIEG